jgi:iron complex transport system substrate-binding protein
MALVLDPVMDITRRGFIMGGASAAALIAAGCGGDDGTDSGSDGGPGSGSGHGSGSAEPSEAGSEVEPLDVGKVLCLGEEIMLADLLALGIRPIACTSNAAQAGFPGVEADTSGIEVIPSAEPNLEQLASFQPEIVLTPRWVLEHVAEDILASLGELVVIEDETLRGSVREIARAFDAPGLEDRVEALIASVDEAVSSGREALGAEGRLISVVTVYPGPTLACWVAGNTAVPETLIELGLTLVPSLDEVGGDAPIGRFYMSLEQIEMLGAPEMIALQSELVEGEPEAFEQIEGDPLWSRLPAVEAGQVHQVDRLGYPGLAGRLRLIDDLTQQLG